MMYRRILFLLVFAFASATLMSQTCTNRGQTPATAFPVCGTATFSQTTVPPCGGRLIPVPGCNDGAAYGDLNPYWYKFTCFQSGTLGFTITPHTLTDDYDWQLFDVTGKDPNDVFTNSSLYVTSNWSSNPGATGTAATATAVTNCAGPTFSNRSKMPQLIEGHDYLLLVSHFTSDNQSGYDLVFNGGTASITDPKEPHFEKAKAFCDGTEIILKFNKRMRCNTVAADGSDFLISSNAATVVSAFAPGCQAGFDMDSLVIWLSNPLPPGTYSIAVKTGSDGNKILDNCDRSVPDDESIPFTVAPIFPTPMDSLSPITCAPGLLELVFSKPIQCSSIAANGSDFVISGSTPVTISSVYGDCTGSASTSRIYIKLSTPILRQGNYTITLQRGSDGNTIIDECGEQTPAGQSIAFITADTVNASFQYNILLGCARDTIQYYHPGGDGIHTWNWAFEDGSSSWQQAPGKIYTQFGMKQATLIVSNGVCRDTAVAAVLLDNELKAAFQSPDILCPEDTVVFKDLSVGRIVKWEWDFGNGNYGLSATPPGQRYNPPFQNRPYTIKLSIEDDLGCKDTVSKQILVVTNCYIAVPNAFTPNGDGLNDYLYPMNAYKAEGLIFRVYNVYGQKVFETRDPQARWDGTFNGQPQASGNYVWMLEYKHTDTQRYFKLKGSTMLIR